MLFYVCLKCGKASDFEFYDIVALNVVSLMRRSLCGYMQPGSGSLVFPKIWFS